MEDHGQVRFKTYRPSRSIIRFLCLGENTIETLVLVTGLHFAPSTKKNKQISLYTLD